FRPPCTRKVERRSAKSGSLVVIIPPSPAPPRFFEGKKLKQPQVPMLPTYLSQYRDPIDCAASSITERSYALAISVIFFISAGNPNRLTGIIAFVRLVMAASSCLQSRL